MASANRGNNNGYPRVPNALHPHFTRLGRNYQVVPNVASIFAGSMRQYMGALVSNPLGHLREVSMEQIRNELLAFTTHTWKSLASTQGGDLENFGLLYGNLNMPFDVNGAGLTLGRGRFMREPVAHLNSNPPDDATLAFLYYGGDFYTLNIAVPDAIHETYKEAKGENSQVDYCRVIPGNTERPAKIILIETKFGKNLYDMQPKEENQLLKSRDTIKGWVGQLNKWRRMHSLKALPEPTFEMYYVNTLIEDAGNYYGEHQSQNIGLLSKKGLAKILGVGENQLTPAQRAKYSEKVTNAVTTMINGVAAHLAKGPLPDLATARRWTLKDFGVDITTALPNFSRNVEAQARAKLVAANFPVCEDLNLQLHAMSAKNRLSERAKAIAGELMLRLGWVMLWSKGPSGSTPIFSRDVYVKMKLRWQALNFAYMDEKAHIMSPPEGPNSFKECSALLSFPEFCKSRNVYLRANNLLKPVELIEGVDVIRPARFTEIDLKYIKLLLEGEPLRAGTGVKLSRTNRVQRAEEGLIKNASKLSYRGGQTVLALLAKTKRNLNARPNKPPVARMAANSVSGLTEGGGKARPFNAARLPAARTGAARELVALLGGNVEPVCGPHGCLPPPQKKGTKRPKEGAAVTTARKRLAAAPQENRAAANAAAANAAEVRALEEQLRINQAAYQSSPVNSQNGVAAMFNNNKPPARTARGRRI